MATNPAISATVAQGALVRVASDGTKTSIPFQYNPDSIKRTLAPNTVGGTQGARSIAARFAGAPTEHITFTCHLAAATDAATQQGSSSNTAPGVSALLAELVLLVYPSTTSVANTQSMLDSGTVEVLPLLADRILLVWGAQSVLPCRITGLSVTEQLYNTDLVPVLATVEVTLQTLTYSDVDKDNASYHDFIVYQQGLEQLAAQARQG